MGTRVLVTDDQSQVLQGVASGTWDAALFVSMESCSLLYLTCPLTIEKLHGEKGRYAFLKKHGKVYVFSTEATELQVLSWLKKFFPEITIEPQFFSGDPENTNDERHTDIGML